MYDKIQQTGRFITQTANELRTIYEQERQTVPYCTKRYGTILTPIPPVTLFMH